MNADEPQGPIWDLVEQILRSDFRIAVAVTGGGSRAVSWLLNHPGASRAMLEAQIPYHPAALKRFLDVPGPHRAVAETARAMAWQASERAAALLADIPPAAVEGASALGIACTAALATDRERRGGDRAHIAVRTPREYRVVNLHFDRDAGADRLAQEEVVSMAIVHALAGSCGSGAEGEPDLPPWVQAQTGMLPVDEPLEAFMRGDAATLELDLEGDVVAGPRIGNRTLLAGSFNPLHAGHEELLAAVGRRTGHLPGLELSIANVDKAELGYGELIGRLRPLRGKYCVAITRAPTFLEKARLFPGARFVIGYDTAARLLDPRYYGDSPTAMRQAMREIAITGCRFLVAGRVHEGVFRSLGDLRLPEDTEALFEAVPEWEFRNDANSTEIRARMTGADRS